MPAVVAGKLSNVSLVILVWVTGGVISLIGALCFAELTTTYPDHGGDYGYLKRAYHRRVGFAFSWAAFWVIRPGNIGTMAMIFGRFATKIFPGESSVAYAIASVVAVSALNLLGVNFGKGAQNILTVAKVTGILLVVGSAFLLWPSSALSTATNQGANEVASTMPQSDVVANEGNPSDINAISDAAGQDSINENVEAEGPPQSTWGSFWLAMVFVMFTYGGWNDIAFVAREVQQPEKNLLRSLVLGTLAVLAICLLVNFGLIFSLGFERMQDIGREWGNPTLYLVQDRMGDLGHRLFAGLVCTSCLGAINAMVFTSPRIYRATAVDSPKLKFLISGLTSDSSGHGWWRALMLQMVVTIAFIAAFSSNRGIENITAATAPYFWFFLALTVFSLIVSRIRYRHEFSGYAVPLYPITPLVFTCCCAFMIYQAWSYLLGEGLLFSTILIGGWVLLGVGLSFWLDE